MTLIVALTCTDGVVFASDGQETIEIPDKPIRATARKIKFLGAHNLWAASGDLSIIQKIESAFKDLEQKLPSSWINEPQCRQLILKNVLDIRKQELDRHRRLYGEGKDTDAGQRISL